VLKVSQKLSFGRSDLRPCASPVGVYPAGDFFWELKRLKGGLRALRRYGVTALQLYGIKALRLIRAEAGCKGCRAGRAGLHDCMTA